MKNTNNEGSTMTTLGYNVYNATPGDDLVFIGHADTLAEARELTKAADGLAMSDWGTARAAGHCAGQTAPKGEEDDDRIEWLSGDFCAVPLVTS